MNEKKEILKKEQESCNIHADRIEKALAEIAKILPLSIDKIQNMNTQELAITELLTGRFAKLQDAIGEKIFPLILINLGEDIKGRSFIDRLNLIEKLGYINDSEHWLDYRNARNAVSHEYPDSPDLMLENLIEIFNLAKELLDYWKNLDQKIKVLLG